MKIAILGTRGIPACYGGFETLAEEVGARLAQAGHQVTVYCRSRYVSAGPGQHKGVALVVLPTISAKYFDTVAHTFLSVIHNILFRRTDAVLLCNSANAVFIPLLRLFRRRVVINVDGLEWKRKKWNVFGRMWYLLGERFAVLWAHRIVTDSRTIEQYYRRKFGAETVFIPYGAETEGREGDRGLERFGLEKDSYILYVGRLEPENNADAVIGAFNRVPHQGLKLAVVGDAPYSAAYIRELKKAARSDVVFCGGVYGAPYRVLLQNACFCVNATEVGGTHPAIVEAMGAGKLVIANDVPENLETVADAGMFFSVQKKGSLEDALTEVLRRPALIEEYGEKARKRVREQYSWEAVTGRYASVL
jgi:glycosyltransferase involved in cell wall biosynthesis